MLATLLALTAYANAPLEIVVSDPKVVAVVLECESGAHKAVVKSGLASFDINPRGCTVNFIRRGGSIGTPGRWNCNLDVCTQQDVFHRPVSDAPGRVNIVLTTEVNAPNLEITCTSGYRNRQKVEENTSIFEGVPSGGDCTLMFKGGVPAKYRPIKEGTYYCSVTGTTAVCTQQ